MLHATCSCTASSVNSYVCNLLELTVFQSSVVAILPPACLLRDCPATCAVLPRNNTTQSFASPRPTCCVVPIQAWVLDSPVSRAAPGARAGEADRVLDDLRCIQLPLPSRQVRSQRWLQGTDACDATCATVRAGLRCRHTLSLHWLWVSRAHDASTV